MATIIIQQVLIRKGRYVHLFMSSIMLILSMIMINNNFNGVGVGVGVGVVNALTIPRVSNTPTTKLTNVCRVATSMMMTNENIPDPSTFREAEVLGLRLMQEGSFDDALVGT
jgi:hypothetical protein